jgi:SAM-dependent methyltransferase
MTETARHFDMSPDYNVHSASQKASGRLVIQSAVEMIKANKNRLPEIKALDLACGPGNLTIEFDQALKQAFPESKTETIGIDYSRTNIEMLNKNYAGVIRGIEASFYNLPPDVKNSDVVISNEGFHWQPAFEMSKIFYMYLEGSEKERHEQFALFNLQSAFKNVYESLRTGGIGVFQFGHKGQIKKIWELVNEILCEDEFVEYIRRIHFPVYHPTVEGIIHSLMAVGFSPENIVVKAFTEDLTETTPTAITAFYSAFSRPGLSQYLPPDLLDHFYSRFEKRLNNMDVTVFRKDLLHRTMVKVKK